MVLGGRGVVPAKEQGRHLFECDKPNCFLHVTFKTYEAAVAEQQNHKCPHWGGETKVAWSVTKTLVQQMWDKLDECMDSIKDPQESVYIESNKTRARAFAECIAIFMPPFFTSADEVAREAGRRWQARQAGDTEYETPGIGARRYESAAMAARDHASPAEGWYGTPDGGYTANPERAGARQTRTSGRARTYAAGQVDTSKLTDTEKKTIKDFNAQMPEVFTAKALAKQFGVSEAVVNAVLSA